MRRLILMRHAKSSWSEADLDDHQRPLNARGKVSAKALGKWLRSEGYQPDQVLCSSAVRTRQTLERLKLPETVPVTFSRGLYLAPAETLLDAVQQATGTCLLVLGHNPGIANMADRILRFPVDHARFADYPTGATLVCDIEGDVWKETAWGAATPQAFVVPRDLVRGL